MDEGNACAASAGFRFVIYQPRSGCPQMVQCRLDVGDGERDVVQALPMRSEKPADRRLRLQGFEQLDERSAHGQHRFLYALLLDDVAIHRFHAVPAAKACDGIFEIVHGDPDVVEVVRKHGASMARHEGPPRAARYTCLVVAIQR